jgi:putative flavoprotein involved in K+ transport
MESMSTRATERYGTIVIGGGQAGLAAGYWLAKAGASFVILEGADRVGDVWRKRWDSLRLFTPARYNRLPAMGFPAPPGSYPTKDQMADFLESYARRFDLPVRTGIRVDRVRKVGDTFLVTAGPGSWTADNVVVATGSYHTPRIPAFAEELDDSILQLHSSDYRRPDQLARGPTLVVGAGNSGAEIAMEASREHRTWLSGRDTGQEPVRGAGSVVDRLVTPLIWFAAHRLLTVDNPLGRKAREHFLHPPRGVPLARVRRKEIVDAGIERVPRTAGVRDGAPVLEDGRVLDATTVVWSTGFRADFGWIDFPVFDDYGMPQHERGVVPSVPGLYFMGLLFQHTLSSALVGGVGKDARYIVEHMNRSGDSSLPAQTERSAAAGGA